MIARNVLIVIPARYASTRLPSKPLMKIAGVEMVKRVAQIAQYACAKRQNCKYVVATDDQRIVDFCEEQKIDVVMTSAECSSGTERCFDAVDRVGYKPEFVVNLQGDNPLCPPWFIEQIIQAWEQDSQAQVFTPLSSPVVVGIRRDARG